MSEDMPRPVTVPDDVLLEQMEEATGPIATAPDIASEVDLSLDAVRERLKRLEERGEVKSKDVGARAVVWWQL